MAEAEEITPERAGALLAAAVQGVAWALIEDETDTSDRGVSEEHYRDAVQRAQAILPTLLPTVATEEPEWEVGVSYSTSRGPSIDGYRVRSYMKVDSVEKAQEFAALVERPMIQKRTKAVPAGEWISVPVEQGDESDA